VLHFLCCGFLGILELTVRGVVILFYFILLCAGISVFDSCCILVVFCCILLYSVVLHFIKLNYSY
jgi:hypothetical protein